MGDDWHIVPRDRQNGLRVNKDPHCGGYIACVKRAGTYPEIGEGQPFYIEDPPHWEHLDDAEEWTLNWDDSDKYRLQYQYLPTVLAHEFGHTIGLQHPAGRGPNIMSNVELQLVLGSDDEKGAQAIYPAGP